MLVFTNKVSRKLTHMCQNCHPYFSVLDELKNIRDGLLDESFTTAAVQEKYMKDDENFDSDD